MASVELSPEAADDLSDIFVYILAADGPDRAEGVLTTLETCIQSLAALHNCGKNPPELLAFGVTLFRELQSPPWRVFYRAIEGKVWVLAVLDGRRNISELLIKRLHR